MLHYCNILTHHLRFSSYLSLLVHFLLQFIIVCFPSILFIILCIKFLFQFSFLLLQFLFGQLFGFPYCNTHITIVSNTVNLYYDSNRIMYKWLLCQGSKAALLQDLPLEHTMHSNAKNQQCSCNFTVLCSGPPSSASHFKQLNALCLIN